MKPEIALLLALLDEAFDRKSWHGTNLRGSLRGLSHETAAWRPAAGRHNIWEVAVHAAYWKYAVRRLLTGEKRGSFAMKGSNWFMRPATVSEKAWREDVALLDDEHRKLRAVIAGLQPAQLARRPGRSQSTRAALVRGVAAHDLYHAGQIQLLKRLRKS